MATEDPHDELMLMDGLDPGEDGEVSAVTLGANPESHIVLLKGAKIPLGYQSSRRANLLADHEEASVPKGNTEATKSGEGAAPTVLLKLDPEQRTEIEALMKSTAEAAAKAATADIEAKLSKMEEENEELKAAAEQEQATKAFADELPGPMREAFLAMSPEEQAAFQAQWLAGKESGSPDPLAKMVAKFADIEKAASEREAKLQKLMDEQEQADTVRKFADLSKVVTVNEFAGHYRKVAKSAPETADYFAGLLKAFAAQDKVSHLFSVRGGDGDTQTGSARDEIEKAAKKLMDADKTLTKEMAVYKVCKTNPELRQRDREEAGSSR